jgi:hypothetical protein
MVQNYETRGKLALIEDQLAGAVEAFRVGELDQSAAILKSIPGLIWDLLGKQPKDPN